MSRGPNDRNLSTDPLLAVDLAPWVHTLGGCLPMVTPVRDKVDAAASRTCEVHAEVAVPSPQPARIPAVASRSNVGAAIRVVTYAGSSVGITVDDISPVSYLLGVFAVLTPTLARQMLCSATGPALVFPDRLTIVRCQGLSHLDPALRAAWPFAESLDEVWEIRRCRGTIMKISVLTGPALRDLVKSIHG
jgi:hypothetical protein